MFFRDEYGGCSREGELSPRCIISGFPSSFAEAQSQLLLAQSESFFPSPSLIYNMFTGTNSKASCNINHLIKATYNDKETANELENLIDKLKYKPDFYINMSTTDSVNRNWGSAESPKSMKETIEHLNTLICDYDNIVNTEGQESEAGETARLKVTTFWTSLRKKGIAKLYHSNNSLVQQGIRAIAGQDQKRRDELLKYCQKKGIEAKVHYPKPMYLQESQKNLKHKRGDFPITDQHTKKIITFPCDQHLSFKQRKFVVDTVKSFYKK